MLQLLGIHKKFDKTPVLIDVCLEVETGSTHALIGSSGSGKTTLLRITLGLVSFDAGYVQINGQKLLSFKRKEWAEKIGYVPQDGGLFPHLSARDNITLTARLSQWDKERIESRITSLRKLVGLEEFILLRYPHELSGGQKQRVALMRAAFFDPPVMLLDEPMAALDPLIRRALQDELKQIFKRLGKTVLIVTHDMGEAVYLADKMTLLHQGRVIQSGTYRDLLKNPTHPFVTQFINAHRMLPETDGLSCGTRTGP